MTITLYHHPYTRAAAAVRMLEEVGVPYELAFVDIMKGAHKAPEILALNPMGKLPVLVDGDVVVTELGAIGLYLADRYASGRLAPLPDDPGRGAYLRWSFFGPSVIEPAAYAKLKGWDVETKSAGWGEYEAMLASCEKALEKGPFILGERFSMADVCFGGTLAYMMQFKMIEPRPILAEYAARVMARPAAEAAAAKNNEVAKAHGLRA